MEKIQGGVCAPKNFKAGAVHCGIRKNRDKLDLSLIISDKKCAAASVYTKNLVKGAPITVTKNNISGGYASAIICNSGNANTCNSDGLEIAEKMCELVATYTGLSSRDVIIASTGVIGQPLPIAPIEKGMPRLIKNLGSNSRAAAEGIMTTDTFLKETAYEFSLGGKLCRIGGIAKGSGMICPNMATMLCFITTDVNITPKLLNKALSSDVEDTFNMVSVDGDTSTNDMVSVLASGGAENALIDSENDDYYVFLNALNTVTTELCKMIAKDGEGATKLLECIVTGASSIACAKLAAKSVINSSLVKAAMFGEDANWGRILCALGYSGIDTNPSRIDVSFKSAAGEVQVCSGGSGLNFSEEKAAQVLAEKEIQILVNLNGGSHCATAWGCDLTYDYVKINGDYRT